MFVGALTQLRYVVVGIQGNVISVPAGFDYTAVRAHAQGAGICITPDIWTLFQLAESTYIKTIKETQR